MRIRGGLCHRPPDGAGDRRDGVGAEGDPSSGVVVPQGLPEGDAADMQRLIVGKVAAPLMSHHPMDQPLVLLEGFFHLRSGHTFSSGWDEHLCFTTGGG